MLAAIYSLAGPRLSAAERDFFRDADPFGFCVFARNIEDPAQLSALCAELRDAVGRPAPVFVDQEGGRVARLRPPRWRAYPANAPFGRLYEADPERALEACRLKHRAIAAELRACGIDADFAPVLDVPAEGAHDVIGDRAFSCDPAAVAALGAAALDGLEAGGVKGVVKHIPGHGRAGEDSHHGLPRVAAGADALEAADFAPFAALAARAAMAMTAHLLYASLDPANPATLSESVVSETIRGGIGFDGLLMTDDLDMKALPGTLAHKTRASLDAGCDIVLHCSGDLAAMREVAAACDALSGRALARAEAAAAPLEADGIDADSAYQEMKALLAPVEAMA